jgi:very-short-patch-repair endonuclease
VKWPPGRAWVTVPRNRKVDRVTQARVHVVYADIWPGDVVGGVTTPVRTVDDGARRLPFDEALAVADSALRAEDVTSDELVMAASGVRGRGATQCRRVATEADARAANPFESVLRAIVLECTSLKVAPQEAVPTRGLTYHPDLVDSAHRVVIEADSWEHHTSKEAHSRDCVRYTALALAGWLVLRFTWEQVMESPAYVRAVLADVERPVKRA